MFLLGTLGRIPNGWLKTLPRANRRRRPMKKMKWITLVTLAGLLGLTGCNKAANTAAKGPVIRGVLVETPKLQQAFAGNTAPEVQNQLGKVQMGVRYGEFQTAVAELEKLAANPTL